MTVIEIEDIKDIIVQEYAGIQIEFKDQRGSTVMLEISSFDAEFLKEKLEKFFHGQTFNEVLSKHESEMHELMEKNRMLMEENIALSLGL